MLKWSAIGWQKFASEVSMRTNFTSEAAHCRQTAQAYAGKAEEQFLLRVAQEFDGLASARRVRRLQDADQ